MKALYYIIKLYKELGRFVSGQRLLESPSEYGIEPPGFISHGILFIILVSNFHLSLMKFNMKISIPKIKAMIISKEPIR